MTRSELQRKLKELGFKRLMNDNKTLCAYYWLKEYLHTNHTPIKAITDVYVENGTLRVVLYDYDDLEIDYDER